MFQFFPKNSVTQNNLAPAMTSEERLERYGKNSLALGLGYQNGGMLFAPAGSTWETQSCDVKFDSQFSPDYRQGEWEAEVAHNLRVLQSKCPIVSEDSAVMTHFCVSMDSTLRLSK